MVTAADHAKEKANTVREAISLSLGGTTDDALTALDALTAQAETAERHGGWCVPVEWKNRALTAEAERDAAVQAAQKYREIVDALIEERDSLLRDWDTEQRKVRAARAALQRIADEGDNNPPHAVVDIARAALAATKL